MTELDRIPDWMQPPTAPAHLDLKTWAQEFRDVYQIAEALCKTPFVPREMLGKQADVTAAIMKGRELGLDPFDALGSIYIVHGRVGFYAEFMRRRIIQAGHTLRIIENTDSRCIIEGTRKDGGDPQRATFTADQARKSGIDLGKYPADKLVARATSRLCRQVFPEVLSGSLIAEDLIDGLIPTDPADPDTAATPPAGSVPTPVQRTRKPRQAKAASTQPKPAPTKEPDNDINELLDDDHITELEQAAAEVQAAVDEAQAADHNKKLAATFGLEIPETARAVFTQASTIAAAKAEHTQPPPQTAPAETENQSATTPQQSRPAPTQQCGHRYNDNITCNQPPGHEGDHHGATTSADYTWDDTGHINTDTVHASYTPEPDPPMTNPQRAKLFALFTQLGLTNRDDQITITSHILGYTVETRRFTKNEARQLIDTLEAWTQDGDYPAHERIRDILNTEALRQVGQTDLLEQKDDA